MLKIENSCRYFEQVGFALLQKEVVKHARNIDVKKKVLTHYIGGEFDEER
jgi:hypothetical protein